MKLMLSINFLFLVFIIANPHLHRSSVNNGSQLSKPSSFPDNVRGGHGRKVGSDIAVVGRRNDEGRRKSENHQSLLQATTTTAKLVSTTTTTPKSDATITTTSRQFQPTDTTPKPINGNWGNWGAWAICTRSCGSGIKTRTRLCNNPAPKNGGRDCIGSPKGMSSCNKNICPGRQCVQIDNTYCPNHPKSKQYSEKSTERCKDTCKRDLSCTGGYHWHHGDVCYHFGVEGAVDDECKGRTIEVVSPPQSHGFDCRAIPGRRCTHIANTYCSNHPRSKQYSEASTERCRQACENDITCTGGYHWHHGDICYLFGVEGAKDKECTGRTNGLGQSHGFVCSGIPVDDPVDGSIDGGSGDNITIETVGSNIKERKNHPRLKINNSASITVAIPDFVEESDKCPDGWTQIGSRCFIYNATLRDYNGSSEYCKHIGGMIASVHSETENNAILSLFPVNNGKQVYIGAEFEDGHWKWHDGSPWWQPSHHGGISGRETRIVQGFYIWETRIAVNCPQCGNDGLWHDWANGEARLGVICTLNPNGAEQSGDSEAINIWAIILSSMVALICLIVSVYCYKKHVNHKISTMTWENNSLYHSDEEDESMSQKEVIPNWLENRSDMIYPQEAVHLDVQLGSGQFGSVYKGKLVQSRSVFTIAIKVPKQGIGVELFIDEAKSMLEIGEYHDNIVNLQGISYGVDEDKRSLSKVLLLLEYCSRGELRSHLIKHRSEFKQSLNDFHNSWKLDHNLIPAMDMQPNDIIWLFRWTYQISNGMEFLTEKNIYHGDLATRNVLLTDNLDAKISDFGLSRRLYSESSTPQTIQSKDGTNSVPLPIKWMAPEVLMHQEFVLDKSDVWSFGVTIWEIFSLGKEPYRIGMTIHQLIYELSVGIRLPNPNFCPPSISTMLRKCFHNDPTERPDFKEIRDNLQVTFNAMREKALQDRLNDKKAGSQIYTIPINNTIDNTMRSRYTVIKKANKLSSNCNSDLNEVIIEDPSLSQKYVSLEKLTQCIQEEDPSNVLQDDCNDPNLEDNDITNIFGDEKHEKIQQYRNNSTSL